MTTSPVFFQKKLRARRDEEPVCLKLHLRGPAAKKRGQKVAVAASSHVKVPEGIIHPSPLKCFESNVKVAVLGATLHKLAHCS